MRATLGHPVRWVGLLLTAVLLAGCAQETRPEDPMDEARLGPTIGTLAEVDQPQATAVEGFGVVGGLPGTGSAACPAPLRAYLKQYILGRLPDRSVNVDEFINSANTAVVRLEGTIPAAADLGQKFDVRIRPVAGSDATSLHGGWLYEATLTQPGTLGPGARTLATVEGPVFVNTIQTAKPVATDGYVIGGGTARHGYTGVLRLRRPDYAVTSAVRNRLNERYGPGTATAVSANDVTFVIPASYQRRQARFVSMVQATYVAETPELLQARIDTFVQQLAASDRKERSESALEAIGRHCLPKLATLLNATHEEVRLRAARCALSLGYDGALEPLRAIAMDATSRYRLEALDAIVTLGRRNDATTLARRLLRDRDAQVVLAAYEHLRMLEDVAVRQELVGRSFYLEEVVQTDRRAIFVARSGDPRIVIFGASLTCRDNVFVESLDGMVMVNSRRGQDHATLTRRVPNRPGVIGPLRSSLKISEIIRTLGSEGGRTRDGAPAGLGASYGDVAAVLEQLCAKGGVAAEFWAGPLPKIGLIVKK